MCEYNSSLILIGQVVELGRMEKDGLKVGGEEEHGLYKSLRNDPLVGTFYLGGNSELNPPG